MRAAQIVRLDDRIGTGLPQAEGRRMPVLLLAAEHDMLADKDEVALRVAQRARLVPMPGLPGQAYLRDPVGYARALLDFTREVTA